MLLSLKNTGSMRRYLILAVLGLAVSLTPAFLQSASAATPAAFYGPFPSWRQVQCGGSDDTAMLQNELNVLGTDGHSPVLYIQPGTCRLTSTLHIDNEHGGCRYGGVSILGADPATTRMLWAGPSDPSQPMLEYGCMFNSRFGRLTWDGAGSAQTVYWQSQVSEYSSGNRHEDEFFVNLSPSAVAIRSGGQGVGDSETEYVRLHFMGPMQAGICLYDYNSLDHWVHDSEFIGPMEAGVANYLDSQNGAGAFNVAHSNFINVTADMQIANTGFFASRWNYSRGDHYHVNALPIGSAAAVWTSQGETIIDPDPNQAQFTFGNPGPWLGMDLTLRSTRDPEGIASIHEGYSGSPGGDIASIGNRYSAPSTTQYSVPTAPDGVGRYAAYALDDQDNQQISDPGPYTITTPAQSSLPVIDVQHGDIAAALAQAGNQPAIVHVPYGTYQSSSSLEVGPNVVLVGDGNSSGGSVIKAPVDPVLHLSGPSHATIAELSLDSNKAGSDILIDNADQNGGLVHIEDPSGGSNHHGIDAENLSQTIVQAQDGGIVGGLQAGGDPGPNVDYYVQNATVHQFMGAGANSDALYEMHGGTLVVEDRFYQGDKDSLTIPGSSGTFVVNGGNYASKGSVNLGDFQGSVTAIGLSEGDNCSNSGVSSKFGPNTLALGFAFGWSGAQPACSQKPTGQAPSLLWQMRHSTGGGTDLTNADDQNLGVSDPAQFLRDHLAPLRAAQPVVPGGRPADVTDVQLIRVSIGDSLAGVKVVGGSSPPAPTNTPAPAPAPTNTAAPTSAPASATATPVPDTGSSTSSTWVTPQASVTASASAPGYPPEAALQCNGPAGTYWSAGDNSGSLVLQFGSPQTFSQARWVSVINPASTETYMLSGSNDGTTWTPIQTHQQEVAGAQDVTPPGFAQSAYSFLRIDVNGSAWASVCGLQLSEP